jgi:hypothetical protein
MAMPIAGTGVEIEERKIAADNDPIKARKGCRKLASAVSY